MSDQLLGKELKLLGHKYNGYFGDPSGFEEILFETTESSYVLLGQGGYHSAHQGVTLRQLTKSKAHKWLVEVLGAEEADKLIKVKSRKRTTKTTKPATGNTAATTVRRGRPRKNKVEEA